MKQLTCEMCGGTDLIKQDGVFVCQSCGCKYSVEEARKMMIEGTVDVSGSTVKVDSSDRVENLLLLARRARSDKNSEDAEKYYSEVLSYDPNNYEAQFCRLYYSAMNCTIGEIESKVYVIYNSLPSICNLIEENVPEEKKKDAFVEVLLGTLDICAILSEASESTFKNSSYSNKLTDYSSRIVPIVKTICYAAYIAEDVLKDVKFAEYILDEGAKSVHFRIYAEIIENQLKELKKRHNR